MQQAMELVEWSSARVNVLLFESGELDSSGRLLVAEERARHLREHLEVVPGRRLRVGELGGGLGFATVLSVDSGGVVLQVGILEPEESLPEMTLIVAIPRPQSLKKVLETAATCGVSRILLCGAERTQKSYFNSKVLATEQLRRHLLLGLEQGVGTKLPEIELYQRLWKLPAEQLVQHRFLATPQASESLEELPVLNSLNADSPFALAVGPEGGWTDDEISWFSERGFSAFRSGSRILRVESAVCALLAQLRLLQRLTKVS